jgi:hypothetical protein
MNSNNPNNFSRSLESMTLDDLKKFIMNRRGINASTNDINKIKTRPRTRTEISRMKQLGTFEKYLLHIIDLHYGVLNNGSKTNEDTKRIVTRRKTEDFLPWPLVRINKRPLTNVRNIELIKNTTVPSLIGTYSMSYAENARFPTIVMSSKSGGKLKTSQVGLFCKAIGEGSAIKGFCNRKEAYKAFGNQGSANIYKKGMRGLSIADISKLVRKGTNNPRIFGNHTYMAQMYELKRIGDSSQIYYAQLINSNDNIFTMKPYDTDLIRSVIKVARGNTSDTDLLRKILLSYVSNNTNNFYYKNAVFWSNDRPACLLAYILKVPFVLRPTGKEMYLVKARTDNSSLKFDGSSILGQIFSGSNQDLWIRKLAILDTYHDFATKFARSKFGVDSAFSLSDILKTAIINSRVPNYSELVQFIEDNFKTKSSISAHEDEIGNFLRSRSLGAVTNISDLEKLCKNTFNEWRHYCVIHDAGKIGGEFEKRRAMSPAIIYDPATSKLNTYNIKNVNTSNNSSVRNSINSLNNKNILRSDNIRITQKKTNNSANIPRTPNNTKQNNSLPKSTRPRNNSWNNIFPQSKRLKTTPSNNQNGAK